MFSLNETSSSSVYVTMVWFSGKDVCLFSAMILVSFSFTTLVRFSSARTVFWLSFLVTAILFFSSMRFLVLLSVSGFLESSKNLNFNSKVGRHSFSVNFFISKVIFS